MIFPNFQDFFFKKPKLFRKMMKTRRKTVIIRYPPYPIGRILPSLLNDKEKTGDFVAQRKFNGQHTVIYIGKNSEVKFFNRHGKSHENFSSPDFLKDEILALNLEKGKEYWLDGELFLRKPGNQPYKNTVVLFDVLQAGIYLYRVSQEARLDILSGICGKPCEDYEKKLAHQISPHLWLAQSFTKNFVEKFEDFLELDLIEGLVLRYKKSVLDNLGVKEYSVPWIVRCRKEHKNYNF